MRILLIANTLPPTDLSGAGEQVLQLAAGLEAAGHEVRVLGRGPGGARGPKVFFPLAIVPATWRVLREFRPHVVQVHESDGGLAALLVRLVRRFLSPRPRLLALLQVSYREEIRAVRPIRAGDEVLGRPGAVEKRFLVTKAPVQVVLGWASARLADGVLVPSRQTGREVEKDYGVRRWRVLPNVTGGLQIDRPDGPDPDLTPGYLLYVGRLRIRKAVEVLLEAMRRLPAEDSGRLLIAGDGEQMPSLQARASAPDLADRVEFLGRCSASRVRQLMLGARALVVPSIYEGMPLVILEAMDEAVPVVASAVSGIPEVVVDGETGWLVPPEDPDALARALRQVLTDPEIARRRGAAGRERLEKTYRPHHAARLWITAAAEFGAEEFGTDESAA